MRVAEIKFKNITAGLLTEDEVGYHFQYDEQYLKSPKPEAISLTMPLREKEYSSLPCFLFLMASYRKDGYLLLQNETGN
jgi:serine/threonine-protein kinase HipA